jgi:hypothetical protein
MGTDMTEKYAEMAEKRFLLTLFHFLSALQRRIDNKTTHALLWRLP